jgi:hypothetical protein
MNSLVEVLQLLSNVSSRATWGGVPDEVPSWQSSQ